MQMMRTYRLTIDKFRTIAEWLYATISTQRCETNTNEKLAGAEL